MSVGDQPLSLSEGEATRITLKDIMTSSTDATCNNVSKMSNDLVDPEYLSVGFGLSTLSSTDSEI
jgi:hypothetical protein